MVHTINRLELELSCFDEEQAFNMRHSFGISLHDRITAVIESICNKYVKDTEWIKIDRLEFDLGWFQANSFAEEFDIVFREKFEKKIIDQLEHLAVHDSKGSIQLSRLALFEYFLQNGTLPWWADAISTDINEICAELFLNNKKSITDFFYRHIYNITLWQRAAFQLNHHNKMILAVSFPELQQAMNLFNNWITQTIRLAGSSFIIEPGAVLKTCNDIMLRNAAAIFDNYPASQECLNIFEQTMNLFLPSEKTNIDNIIAQLSVASTEPSLKSFPFEGDTKIQTRKNKSIAFTEDPVQNQPGRLLPADEKYLVTHAGIILLGAFLNPFFSKINLLDGAGWKNKEVQYRAVHLLRFLSTGEQESPEFNLGLEKIICGLNLAEPVPVDITLSAAEINESQNLLESVIEHWKALKNTSVNGLRNTFLKRDGLLRKKERDWLLQVERKTLDVLIDSIPWGFSTLRFPWTEQILLVEW